MAKRQTQADDSDYTPSDSEERPRAIRRAARGSQRLLEKVMGGMSSSGTEGERAPRAQWRKRVTAARKPPRGRQPRKPHARPGPKPKPAGAAPRPATPAALPAPDAPPVTSQQQAPLPRQTQPAQQAAVAQPGPPATQLAPKLREHHHEFLSEYSQHQRDVAAAAGLEAMAAMQLRSASPSALIPPALRSRPSSGNASKELDAAIAAVFSNVDALAPARQSAKCSAAPSEAGGQGTAGSGSSVASSFLEVSSPMEGIEKGFDAFGGADPESGDVSDASTALCAPLARSGGSCCMWRLPSNAALLSFASCMAA